MSVFAKFSGGRSCRRDDDVGAAESVDRRIHTDRETRWSRRRLAGAGAAAAAVALGVSVTVSAVERPAESRHTYPVEGRVTMAPTCPDSTGPKCPAFWPLKDGTVEALHHGDVAATATTDAYGYFSLRLATGRYVLGILDRGNPLTISQIRTDGNQLHYGAVVQVSADVRNDLAVSIDTGIR